MSASTPPPQPHRFTGWKPDGREAAISMIAAVMTARWTPTDGAGYHLAREICDRHFPYLPADLAADLIQESVAAHRVRRGAGSSGDRPMILGGSDDVLVALFPDIDQRHLRTLHPEELTVGRHVYIRRFGVTTNGTIERVYTAAAGPRALVRRPDSVGVGCAIGELAVEDDAGEVAA